MPSRLKSIVLPLMAALLWGTAFVAQTDNTAPTFVFNAARSWVAVPFLLLLVLVFTKGDWRHLLRENTPAGTKSLWIGGILCGTALFLACFFQQYGMDLMPQGTGAGRSGFITAFYMILVPVFGLFFGEKNGWNIWIAAVLALFGLYLLCVEDGFSVEKADLTVFCCSVFFALQIHAIDRFSVKCNCIRLSCVQFLTCAVLSTVSALLFNRDVLPQLGTVLQANLKNILYLGIFSSGVAYLRQMVAQKGTNPAVVSILLSMESVFSVLAGAVLKGELLSARAFLGCGIMFLAVLLAQFDIIGILRKKDKSTM